MFNSSVLIFRKAKNMENPENPYEEPDGTVNKAYDSESEHTGF